jgi:methyltransferase (TIGR00027 family)
MEFIAHHVHIAARPEAVVEAITTEAGLRGWWTDCEVGRAPGEEAVFRFDPPRQVVFRIDRIDARGIEMTCVRNTSQPDWQGTHLALRVVADGAGSYVDLLHDGYPARNVFYEVCVGGWAHHLKSLRLYCETGRGTPWGAVGQDPAPRGPGDVDGMDALGLTSRWVAAARARESARPDRLFSDPLADALAGPEGHAFLVEMARASAVPGRSQENNPYIPIRTRFLDNIVAEAVGQGIRQVVILAAGMDARAFRIDWPAGTTVFEVEREGVLRYKEAVLAREKAAPKARRVVLASDLREDWRGRLREAGFDPSRPSAFLVEGLIVYLPDEAAALGVLVGVAEVAAIGSVLGTDISSRTFIESPWTQAYREALIAKGVAWTFGTDDPEGLLARAGWKDVHVMQPYEVEGAADRWPFPPTPRTVSGVPRSFLASARR